MRPIFGRYLQSFRDFKPTKCDTNKHAFVILDDRVDYWTPHIYCNFNHFLDDSWNYYFIGNERSCQYIDETFSKEVVTIPLSAIYGRDFKLDWDMCNSIWKTSAFYDVFKEDYILSAQADDTACFSQFQDKWYDYTLIGAPCGDMTRPTFNTGLAGMDVHLHREVASTTGCSATLQLMQVDKTAEDVFFTESFREIGGKLPSLEEAMEFSVESFYHKHPFGVHGLKHTYMTDEIAAKIVAGVSL